MEHGDALVEVLRWQRAGCLSLDSTFYAGLCEQLILDVEAGGPITSALAPFADQPFEAAYVLRFLAGIHRMVLRGTAPALARHYPSTGGDGDAAAAAIRMGELLTPPPAAVLDALTRPPQTNEVGRSVALASGLMLVADELGLPISLREIGASAGLNLRLDAYWYEQGGQGWGDRASPVRFVDLWHDGVPPFGAGTVIADRRGCDPNPIDVSVDDGAVALMSYVWPEPQERFVRARAAIGVARENPVAIEPVPVEDWLPRQLAARPPDTALVFMHSVVWQYLDAATRTLVATQLEDAGCRATGAAPLAWLRLEPTPITYAPAELRLTVWNGDAGGPRERLLATTNFHGGPIRWTGGREPTGR